MTTPQNSTPWQDSFSLRRPSWRRSEALDLVHPVDDVVGVLRRIRLTEGAGGVGPQAEAAYAAALVLMDTLHDLIRHLPHPNVAALAQQRSRDNLGR